jgi:hypothetical protein
MEPLGVIVLDEFLDQVAQVSLAENDELVQALVLYGPRRSLGVRTTIGAPRRNLHALHGRRSTFAAQQRGDL